MNRATEVVTGRISIGGSPTDVVLTPDGSTAFVSDATTNAVITIDVAKRSITSTIPVGRGANALAMSSDGRTLISVGYQDDTVSIIDVSSRSVTATVPVGSGPYDVAISPNNAKAYVTNTASKTVSILDLSTKKQIGSIELPSTPYGVAFTSDGGKAVVVGRQPSAAYIIDTSVGALAGDPIPFPSDTHPMSVATSPTDRRIYVTFHDPSPNTSLVVLKYVGRPSPPSQLNAEAHNASATLKWGAPVDTGGLPLTGYRIDVKEGEGPWTEQFTRAASDVSATVTGLKNGTPYRFRVVAVNSFGSSEPTETSTAITLSEGPIATNLRVTEGKDSVTLSWDPPAGSSDAYWAYDVRARLADSCRSDITAYNYWSRPGESYGAPSCWMSDTVSFRQISVTGLGAGQTVTFSVQIGEGAVATATGTTWVDRDTGQGRVHFVPADPTVYQGIRKSMNFGPEDLWMYGPERSWHNAFEKVRVEFQPKGTQRWERIKAGSNSFDLPYRSGTIRSEYRGTVSTTTVTHVRATRQMRLKGGGLAHGRVKEGSLLVDSYPRVMRKYRDGTWQRLRSDWQKQFRPLGGGPWRKTGTRVNQPGWYRLVTRGMTTRSFKVTSLIRRHKPSPTQPSRPCTNSEKSYIAGLRYDLSRAQTARDVWKPYYLDLANEAQKEYDAAANDGRFYDQAAAWDDRQNYLAKAKSYDIRVRQIEISINRVLTKCSL